MEYFVFVWDFQARKIQQHVCYEESHEGRRHGRRREETGGGTGENDTNDVFLKYSFQITH